MNLMNLSGSGDLATVVRGAGESEKTMLPPEIVRAIEYRISCYFSRRRYRQLPDNVLVHQPSWTARMSVQARGRFYELTLLAGPENVLWCLRGECWGQPDYVDALLYTQELLKNSGSR